MQQVTIYTDGSSRGNPGPGGFGAVLLYTDATGVTHTKELSGGFKLTTNNRMELLAVICALEALKYPCEVEIHSDSQYLVNAFNNNWIAGWKARGWKTANKRPVKNRDLWERLLCAVSPHHIRWMWVKGHAGNTYNERCDQLAVSATDSSALPEDEGYRKELSSGD